MTWTPFFVLAAVAWMVAALVFAALGDFADAVTYGVLSTIWVGLAISEHRFKGGR